MGLRTRDCPVANHVLFAIVSVLLGCSWAGQAHAQTVRAHIAVVSDSPARLRIEVGFPTQKSVLSFRNSYAGVLGLGERIERVEAELGGKSVAVKKLGPGEFETEKAINHLRYEVNLAGPMAPAQMSHVSWLNASGGLLMLADLLPRVARESGEVASIHVDVPSHWFIESNLNGRESNYLTTDPEKAVFIIAPYLQKKTRRAGAANLSVVGLGRWPFSDNDAMKISVKLVEEYAKLTGHPLKSDTVVMLVPYPGETGPERWTAETRGNAVVVLLGTNASRTQVLSKLGIVLTHEIFHLWVPNGLALVGDYDWFFEGFTLYQALQMALRLRLISFDTYLETIARVYDSYLSSPDADRISLIEASQRRWTTASSLVYDKGMLAAFAYDLALRNATNCEQSLDDVYRRLFRSPGTGQGSANETIISILNSPAALNSFGREYVESAGRINLQTVLMSYGLQLRPGVRKVQASKIVAGNDLNKAQRNALRCIGYRG